MDIKKNVLPQLSELKNCGSTTFQIENLWKHKISIDNLKSPSVTSPQILWYRGECCPFFLHFDSLTSFFEFFSSQGNHKSLKKTGCSYTFQFFWSPKIFEIDVKWRFFWSCDGRNSGFWGSCWSTHRSWQRCRCWKYRTRHWHVWRVFVFKKLLQFKSCNDNMDKLEPWQILRNQQTIRDSWLGLVIVPLVCHCQRSKKKHLSFILRVRGKNAKHCPKNHYPACRKSFLCWAWADVAQHALDMLVESHDPWNAVTEHRCAVVD